METVGDENLTTIYFLHLYKDGIFSLRHVSGTCDENSTSYLSFGIFDDTQDDIRVTYSNLDQKGIPMVVEEITGVIKRSNENLIWNGNVLTPYEKEPTPQAIRDILGSDVCFVENEDRAIYLGHLLLAKTAVPSGFTGSFKYEETGGYDGWSVYSEEYHFYPNGMFKSHLCSAGHDYSNDTKKFGNYIKRENEIKILGLTYYGSYRQDILPQKSIMPYANGEIISPNYKCKQI